MGKILCVSAHPDDCEVGCSGYVRQLIEKGYRAYLVVVTNGENGFKIDALPVEERIAIRRKEQEEAAGLWGMEKVFYFGFRDGFLEYNEDLRRRLVEVIKMIRPQMIFTFDPANRLFDDLNLQHRDHRMVGEAVFDACFAARNRWMYPGEAHSVEKICFFASQTPNLEIDITHYLQFKIDLLARHRSQFPDKNQLTKFVKQKINPPEQGRHKERFRVISGQRKI